MKKPAMFAPLLGALVLLGACATATPYQAASDSDRGYADQQLESDRWQVSFAGNSLTDRKTVETYLLFRAAELTRQEGYDHFRVVRRDTDEDSRLVSTGFSHAPYYSGFYCNYAYYGAYGRRFRHPAYRGFYRSAFHDPWGHGFGPSDYREIVRYEANAEIIMGRGAKPEDDPAYFNAEEVLMNLAGSIQRPEA
ncbi:MAG: hypothetical protein GVY06_10575 [Alphaproteobacteria bacterium]|jgi:hypothetical protein|nr:hypothetical protein [Alphaproteobacteria bacterium]